MKKMILAVGALLFASAALAQNVDLKLTTVPDASKKALVPTLNWTTTPSATSCTATGSTGWAGAKAASGTLTLAATTNTVSYALACSWPGNTKATVTWTAPTKNKDGSAYDNPGGYRIRYGRTTTTLDQSVYINDPAARSWTSPDLATGAWVFGVIAFNTQGLESELSNLGNKTMSAGASNSASVGVEVKLPEPPVLSP